jgi:hypothetical protein
MFVAIPKGKQEPVPDWLTVSVIFTTNGYAILCLAVRHEQ